jgi:hypothetical protein
MLYRANRVFVNGETAEAAPGTRALLARLANRRALPAGTSVTPGAAALLYTWYRAGYLAPAR